jgi:hypothetical protein
MGCRPSALPKDSMRHPERVEQFTPSRDDAMIRTRVPPTPPPSTGKVPLVSGADGLCWADHSSAKHEEGLRPPLDRRFQP